MALSHLYYGCVLQAYPDRGEFTVRWRQDFDMFVGISLAMRTTDQTVLDTTMNLCHPDGNRWDIFWSEASPDSLPEWLSHVLPYHFVTGRVNEDIEDLAIKVMSKLLSSPSSSSKQIVANCIFLACVMVGAQVDKKDIVRIDKSPTLPRLRKSLLAQFQKALWAYDGDELDQDRTGVARRALRLLDIICRIIELAGRSYRPLFHTMRNLDVCRKIYSRARSSEQKDASVSLAVLRKHGNVLQSR
ncbi:uncharacterized protein HD556DRAFT_159702 [Suillus plorans]|uniref:Uncharacterized protein n=1 Tax=Suillus plorans TaxID=116603 RepID=A0A9P7DN31_9AGAM|nr:uncharacterized protein HD556DRAFT_159702 [Suillus plorans]KAG1798900.1 hypothetical protein HD556DRAFT_159702 [Suillus plorans]